MHSDDEASLSSEPSHNQIHKVPCTLLYASQIVSFATFSYVLWCCRSHEKVQADAVSASQLSCCGVELSALLIGIVTFGTSTKQLTTNKDLTAQSTALPFKPYNWQLFGRCCCHKLNSWSLPSSQVKSTPLGTSHQQLQQQLQLRPIRTRSLASRQPPGGSPPPQQARALAPWQPWRMYQTRGLFNKA